MCKILKLIATTLMMMSLTFVSCVTESNNIVEAPKVRVIEPVEIASTEEDVELVEEPIVEESESETEPIEVIEEELLTQEEIELIALVTMAEAEGEPEEGQRLVIDTILNRVDHERFPDTVHGVIYQKNQFTSMSNGRVDKCYVKEDICELVREELKTRTNHEVIFFTADEYGKYGKPMFPVANHYFSSYA